MNTNHWIAILATGMFGAACGGGSADELQTRSYELSRAVHEPTAAQAVGAVSAERAHKTPKVVRKEVIGPIRPGVRVWQSGDGVDSRANQGDTGDTGGDTGDTGGDTGGPGDDTGGGGDVDGDFGDCPTDVDVTEVPCPGVGGLGGLAETEDTGDTGGGCTCVATSWCEMQGDACMCYTQTEC